MIPRARLLKPGAATVSNTATHCNTLQHTATHRNVHARGGKHALPENTNKKRIKLCVASDNEYNKKSSNDSFISGSRI